MLYAGIDTFYLTTEQLVNSPSSKDGIDEKTERLLRVYGAELVQEAGILLRLPQACMATGQVLFQRFFCKKSFARFNVKGVAASCIWLASKLEENFRKAKDVMHVFYRMEQRREGLPLEPLDTFSTHYQDLKTDLVRTERHLLKEMGFVCHVEHPHKFIFTYLQQLEVDDFNVKQEAWGLANDSLRTTLCVRFKSEVVACGVIYIATRWAQIPLPEDPPWWLVFDCEKREILEVCRVMEELYKMPKAKYIEVGKGSKSFVLTSREWTPPKETPGNNGQTAAKEEPIPLENLEKSRGTRGDKDGEVKGSENVLALEIQLKNQESVKVVPAESVEENSTSKVVSKDTLTVQSRVEVVGTDLNTENLKSEVSALSIHSKRQLVVNGDDKRRKSSEIKMEIDKDFGVQRGLDHRTKEKNFGGEKKRERTVEENLERKEKRRLADYVPHKRSEEGKDRFQDRSREVNDNRELRGKERDLREKLESIRSRDEGKVNRSIIRDFSSQGSGRGSYGYKSNEPRRRSDGKPSSRR